MTNLTTQTTFESREWGTALNCSPHADGSEDVCEGTETLLGQSPGDSVAKSLPLLPLTQVTNWNTHSYAFATDLQPTLRKVGFEDVLYVDFAVDPPNSKTEVPFLMAARLPEAERPVARHPRKVSWTPIRGARVNVPPRLLNAQGTAEVGLGLNLSSYSNDNRLLFRVLPAEDCIALRPVKYEQGEQYTYAGEKRPLA